MLGPKKSICCPWHTGELVVKFGVGGVGFTVMVNVMGVPGQPADVGVTVMVLVTGVLPAFVAVKAPMFPLPEAAKPMEVLLLVQL